MKHDTPPDWTSWSDLTTAPARILAALSLGLDPARASISSNERVESRANIIRDELIPVNRDSINYSLLGHGEYSVSEFRAWAASQDVPWPLPPEFPTGAASRREANRGNSPGEAREVHSTHVDSTQPSTANNPGHACYSEELAIAFAAWNALYAKSDGTKPNGGNKNAIIKWLNAHHPELSGKAVDRIATLVNPSKEGGATPTTKKT